MLAYCGLHVFLRGMVSETAGIDDVDQILRAQAWSWGYGPQPPLYTWLTKIFLGTFGYNIFSLVLLKECLVFAIFALTYANTRLLTRSHRCGLAAAALLEFLPSIAWESHRELTHTVLASALVLASVYAFLRLDPNRGSSYLLFGVCSGLGMSAKYNFAIVFAALLLAAFSVREPRPTVLNRNMLLAALVMLAICAPHAQWVFQHQELAFSSVHKLKIDDTGRWWVASAAGLSKFAIVVIAHTGLLLGFVGLIFRRSLGRIALTSPQEKLFWRMLLWILGIVACAIVWFRVTGPRDRYVQPLFVWLPIFLVALVHEQLSVRRVANIAFLSAAIAGVILLVAPGRILLTERLHKHEELTIPFQKLAQDLRPAVEKAQCIIAEDHPLAGNLRLWFPNKLVLDPEVGPLFAPVSGEAAALVWDAGKTPAPPQDLLRFARSFSGKATSQNVSRVEEPLRYHRQGTVRLGMEEMF